MYPRLCTASDRFTVVVPFAEGAAGVPPEPHAASASAETSASATSHGRRRAPRGAWSSILHLTGTNPPARKREPDPADGPPVPILWYVTPEVELNSCDC